MALAALVASAFFMEMLDSTVILTALPRMAEAFQSDAVHLSVGVTAYLLALAVLIPASGWVADHFGTRRIFLGAIVVFTGASVLCGLSGNLWQFTAMRVLQGVGAAMMSPVGRIALLRVTEKRDLVRSMNIYSMSALAAPVIGPPLGGFITTYWSWRWIFFLNLPIGLAGLFFVLRMFPDLRAEKPRPFDFTGFMLNGGALVGLLYGMNAFTEGASALHALPMMAAGVILAVFAFRHARRDEHPLVAFTALRVPSFATSVWAGVLFRIALSAPTFLLPLLLQLGMGLDAFRAGMLILVHAAADMATKALTAPALRRFGFRSVLLWSALAFGLCLFGLGFNTSTTPLWLTLVLLVVSGSARSFHMTALNALQFSDVPPAQLTAASTLAGMAAQISQAVGVAGAALVLNGAVWWRGGSTTRLLATDFRWALVISALVAVASWIYYAPLSRATGAHVSGHRTDLANTAKTAKPD
ncbi:MAG: MFS transporter [Steroidobacteraceae bacterium]